MPRDDDFRDGNAEEDRDCVMAEPSENDSESEIEVTESMDVGFEPPGIAGFEEDKGVAEPSIETRNYDDAIPVGVNDEILVDSPEQDEIAVHSISSPSYYRRGERAASLLQCSLKVIQHANTGLSSIDLLFAPLVSAHASPAAFPVSSSSLFSQVVVLDVQGNVLRDLLALSILSGSLRMLNATDNQIASLPSRSFWSQFTRLESCFLARNFIGPWTDGHNWLEALSGAGRLRWLTLEGNPIMSRPRARVAIVNKLPRLYALDDLVVGDHERVLFART